MKTPRLALLALALPALLLAPSAKAGAAPAAPDLPKWAVVDESFRAWPTIYFTVGKDNRALRCRYSECNPETNKGQSNLYVMIEGARVPIDATIFEYHDLGKWDPRRLTGQTQTKTSRIVKAHRQNYSSQLSNFKLDNTGGKLSVVQGGIKYAATTDLRTVYVSETGGAVAVAPPTKKAADTIKPDGTVPPVTPERRPTRPTRPAKVSWCDPATGNVHAIPASQKPGAGWTPMGTAPGSACTKTDGKPPAPEVTAPVVKISAKETPWLTRGQAADLATEMAAWDKSETAAPARASALRDIVKSYRKEIVTNLLPSPNSAQYATAAADPKATTASIDATLPAEVWGGANNSIVGPFGDRLDIQLSKEEWAVLTSSAFPAGGLSLYEEGRKGADGNADSPAIKPGTYSAAAYDPIRLHLFTMAARAAVGTIPPGTVVKPPAPPGTDPGTPAKLLPLLTREQLKSLTPKEINEYLSILEAAKGVASDPNVQNVLKNLLATIEKRKGQPYPSGGLTEENFKDAPSWHKDIFCSPATHGAKAITRDKPSKEIDNSPVSMEALLGMVNKLPQQGGTPAGGSGRPPWAKGPCKDYDASWTPEQTKQTGKDEKKPHGVDADLASKTKEVPDTVANSWLMRGQIQTFAQGALIGLVIGSLFGPIGLIAGPLLFGALMYGMQKYDAVKADNAAKKEKSAGD